MTAYLVILGDRDAISWVLHEERMAFPATPRAEVAALAADDRLFLYATRGAWRNPTRDRGRIIGTAVARSSVRKLDEPVEIAGRTLFPAATCGSIAWCRTRAGWNCSRSWSSWRPSPNRRRRASTCAGRC